MKLCYTFHHQSKNLPLGKKKKIPWQVTTDMQPNLTGRVWATGQTQRAGGLDWGLHFFIHTNHEVVRDFVARNSNPRK